MLFAICEDERVYREEMLRIVNEWKAQNHYPEVELRAYETAEDLLNDWETGRVFDALFLDIGFAHLSGFALAQRVRESDGSIPIVFVTASDEYVQRGYEVEAYRYLRKPICAEEVRLCLERCRREALLRTHAGFVLQMKGCTMRVPYRDVLYIDSGIHSVNVHLAGGETHRVPLKGLFERYAAAFPQDSFVRCHRGYIVNLAHAERYDATSIRLITGEVLPIGRAYREQTLSRLQNYFFREVL